jgi:HEAT repeat protein
LPEINLEALAIPEGMAVAGPGDLRSRCAKGLKSKEPVIRGVAAARLASLEPDRKKAIEGLLKVLKEDSNEYVRRSVAGALLREGWSARSALPELRKFVDDPDVNVKNAIRQAVAGIEKSKEEPGWEEQARRAAAIQKDIGALLKARAARKRS